jgi:tetratricopeptide (TPR) repeat protein
MARVSVPGQTAASQTDSAQPNRADDLAAKAAAARDAGHPDEAIRYYREALKARPTWDEGWWYVATLSYDAEHYAEAIPAFRTFLQIDPNAGAGWNFLGLCEFETKDYKNAFIDLQKGQDLGFEDTAGAMKVAKYHIALLLNLNGQFDKATAILTTEFGQSSLPDQIKIALGMAMLRVPLLPDQVDPSKDALLHAAGETAAFLAASNFDQAFQAFQQMLKDYPNTPYLQYAYASALIAVSRDGDAAAHLRAEVRLTPESALPHIGLASVELRANAPEEAVREAEHAVKLAPQSAAAHDVLGQVLRALGRKGRAEKELDAAGKLQPERPEVEAGQVRFYARSSVRGQISPAAGSQSATGTNGTTQSASFEELSQRAATAQQSGKIEEAIATYQSALQIRPDWQDGLRYLGALQYGAARYPEAISTFKILVEVNPKMGLAWALLGLCEFETQDYKNALAHMKHGQDVGISDNPQALSFANYHLALLLDWNGEFDRATNLLIPQVGNGYFDDESKIAMGLALLRIQRLPSQLDAAQITMVRTAGETAALLSQSKYAPAFQIFEQMLKDYPKTPFLHYAYGAALASISRYDEAQAQLREETRVNPENVLAYTRMTSIALQLHHPEEALPSAERAVQIAPQLAEARYVKGRALLELGKQEQAIQEFEAADKLAPNSPEVHFILARAYAKAKQPEQAERERAIFARLNALAEHRKSMSGSQSYGDAHNRGDLSPAEAVRTPSPSNPE